MSKVKSQKGLRDYFAAKALMPSWSGMSVNDVAHSADLAYAIADEMLRVRNNETKDFSEAVQLRERVEAMSVLLNDVNNWLVCSRIATPEDMAQSFEAYQQEIEALLNKAVGE